MPNQLPIHMSPPDCQATLLRHLTFGLMQQRGTTKASSVHDKAEDKSVEVWRLYRLTVVIRT